MENVTRSVLPPPWVLASIPLFAVALAQNADARSCTVASDCPKGFTCASANGGANDASTPGTVLIPQPVQGQAQALSVDGQAIDSNAGSMSTPTATPGSTSPEAGVVASDLGSECTSSSCQSNSDCGQGFSCYQGLYCVGGPGGVPGNACVPQWQAPCSADSDCGGGFQCASTQTACNCSGTDAGVPPGAVSVPCTEAVPGASPPIIAAECEAGPTCLCWGADGVCQQAQMGPCSQSTDCPMGWTCTMMACEPPNSDLAWQGTLYQGAACAPRTAPGSGVSNGSTVSTGGSGGPTESNASSGSAGSGGPTGAGGPPAPKSGGCEIAMKPAGSASSCAVLILLASVAQGLRRKVKPESRLGERADFRAR
jgi:hypothetical protein